ncbi:hypothetical protein CCACVL1_04194 [Corchorus capsularis]|uniref:Uncharacterized protein n=1 Tax=Corchorus capsularis TaxID=210143 RepID=A0A1R3JUH6_COCAP|nr:hypothetical protein CCACVL1_04194 [Corchorus capsularis]
MPQYSNFNGQNKPSRQAPSSSNISRSSTSLDVANLPPMGRENSSSSTGSPYALIHAQTTLKSKVATPKSASPQEVIEIDELFANKQSDGVVANILKDVDDAYFTSNSKELENELTPDPSLNPTACNANDSSWGAIITYSAPSGHALTMPILKNSISINQVEKRSELVEDPLVIPIDMNSAPPNESETSVSIAEIAMSNLPNGWVRDSF